LEQLFKKKKHPQTPNTTSCSKNKALGPLLYDVMITQCIARVITAPL